MYVANLRVGHATNSSSSHSIVIMRPGHRAPETNFSGAEFGWEKFILSDVDSKLRYLAVDQYADRRGCAAFVNDFGDFVGREHAAEIYGEAKSGYIDHESIGTAGGIPKEVLLHPSLVILGGNDNGGDFTIPHADPMPRGGAKVRKDGAATVFYWSDSGFKIRLCDDPYTKASAPELVDVKITDYCPYGCYFCYQGSTKQGQHAAPVDIVALADRLAAMGVFEVALGGGEPVLHPDFPAVIDAFADRGITPNVTAFGTEWLGRPDVMRAFKRIGGIGVSVQAAKDLAKVNKIREALQKDRIYNVQVLPQHAVGTGDLMGIVSTLKDEWSGSLLLLGFKNVGRGHSGPRVNVTGADVMAALMPILNNEDRYEPFNLSVDTAFVDQFPDVLKHLKVPGYLTSSPEGKFSMYVDLVRGVMGPSSYCQPEQYVPYQPDAIEAAFARW